MLAYIQPFTLIILELIAIRECSNSVVPTVQRENKCKNKFFDSISLFRLLNRCFVVPPPTPLEWYGICMVFIFSKFIVDWFQLNMVNFVVFFFRKILQCSLSIHRNILELDTPLSIANCFYSTILLTKTNSIHTQHSLTRMCICVYVSFANSMVYTHSVCKQIYTSVHSVSILN